MHFEVNWKYFSGITMTNTVELIHIREGMLGTEWLMINMAGDVAAESLEMARTA